MRGGSLLGFGAILACGARTELDAAERSEAGSVDVATEAPRPTTCFVHERSTLANGVGQEIVAVAVDEGAVYWTSFDAGTIQKVAKAGGTVATLASGRNGPVGIAVASGNVFWAEFNGNAIAEVASGGGPITVLAQNQNGAYGVTIADHVYWTMYRGGAAGRVPLDGGAPQILADTPGNYVGMASDGQHVFWTVQENAVMRYTIATQTVDTLASKSNGAPWSVTTDGVNVYWTELGANGAIFVLRASVAGGAPSVLGSVSPKDPKQCPGVPGNCQGALATDGVSVYFTLDADAGSVWKLPVGGGTPTAIAQGEYRPYGVAVDEGCVYWGDWDGTVLVAPK